MMRPDLIITRLREECPIFEQRVAGAASLKLAAENPDLAVPNAFVLLHSITPSGESELSPYNPEMVISAAVVVAVANTSDQRGQEAGGKLLDCFVQVRNALLGWQPAPEFGCITVDGLSLDDATVTRARMFAQIDISAAAMVRDIS